MNKLVIPIKGMHCRSCEILLTDGLEELPGIQKADVSLKSKTATVHGQPLPSTQQLQQAIKEAGYAVGYDEIPVLSKNKQVYRDAAIGIALVAILAILLTSLGITNLARTNIQGASGGVIALIMGLTAGFSTCMALIGGLVLGISARHSEKHPTASPSQKFRPHLFFNLGRFISFVVFGAIIGALGSAFQLGGSLLGILMIGVGIVMFLLGLQLTEIFPRLSGGLTLPSGLAKKLGIKKHGAKEYSHKNSMLIGALTFFLPCGFTQAMQLFAVSTGSPVQGALIMGAFAIGTMPGLLGIGGLTSVVRGAFAQKFFRIIGVSVAAMALINMTNGYTLLGIPNPFARRDAPVATVVDRTAPVVSAKPNSSATPSPSSQPQSNILQTTYTLKQDIIPTTFTAKVGQKTTMEVLVKEDGQGCMSTIMIPGLVDKPQFLKGGSTVKMTFTPDKTGEYKITCAMGLVRGSLQVI